MLSGWRTLALLCAVCAAQTRGQDAGWGCPRLEVQNVGIQAVQQPSKVLDQFYDMKDATECFDRCCQMMDSGCNMASFVPVGGQLVCMLLKCDPLESCVTGEYISGRLATFDTVVPASGLPPVDPNGVVDIQPSGIPNPAPTLPNETTETWDDPPVAQPDNPDPAVGVLPDQVALGDPVVDGNAAPVPDQATDAAIDNTNALPNEAAIDDANVVPVPALLDAPIGDDFNIVPDQSPTGVPADDPNGIPFDLPVDNAIGVPDLPTDLPVDNVVPDLPTDVVGSLVDIVDDVVPDLPTDVPVGPLDNVVPDVPTDLGVPVDTLANFVPDVPTDLGLPVDTLANVVPDLPTDVPVDNVNIIPDHPADISTDNVDVDAVPGGAATNSPSEDVTTPPATVSAASDLTESSLFSSSSFGLDQSRSQLGSSPANLAGESEMMSLGTESGIGSMSSLFPSESLEALMEEQAIETSLQESFMDSLNETIEDSNDTIAQNWTGMSEIPHALLSDQFASTWLTSEGEEEEVSSEWPLNSTLLEESSPSAGVFEEPSPSADVVEEPSPSAVVDGLVVEESSPSPVTDEWLPDIAESATTPTWDEWFWGDDEASTPAPDASEDSDGFWEDEQEQEAALEEALEKAGVDVDQFPTSSQSWPPSSSSNWFSSSSSSGLWGSELESSVVESSSALTDPSSSAVFVAHEEITVVLADGQVMSEDTDFDVPPEAYPAQSGGYAFTPLVAVGACAGVAIVLLSLMFLSRRIGGYRSRAQYKPLREVRDPHMSGGKKYYDEV